MVKNPSIIQETWVWSLARGDALEKGRATHCSTLPGEFHGQRSLAGYIPWGRKEWTQMIGFHFHFPILEYIRIYIPYIRIFGVRKSLIRDLKGIQLAIFLLLISLDYFSVFFLCLPFYSYSFLPPAVCQKYMCFAMVYSIYGRKRSNFWTLLSVSGP